MVLRRSDSAIFCALEDDEQSGVGFGEISNILVIQGDFSCHCNIFIKGIK